MSREKKPIIIDADSMIWGVAYKCREEEDMVKVVDTTDGYVNSTLTAGLSTGITHYIGLIQGPIKSFRHKCFSDYKANRPEYPDWFRKWRAVIENRMYVHWGFYSVNEYEVDDAVASVAAMLRHEGIRYIVARIDKDLRQIPGEHYNYKTGFYSFVAEWRAERSVMEQVLAGDRGDNITGIPGVGPVTADKLLAGAELKQGLWDVAIRRFIMLHRNNVKKGLIDFCETFLKVTLREDMDIESFLPIPIKKPNVTS